MKTTLAILTAALCVASQPALAKGPSSQKQAVALWKFAHCAVMRKPAKVSEFLGNAISQPASDSAVRKFSKGVPHCLPAYRRKAMGTIRPANFVGALSGAAFVRNHHAKPLPDYSAVPRLVTDKKVDAAPDSKAKARLILLAFGECVFRTQPNHTRAFLAAMPMSPAATKSLKPIAPILGGCLAVKKGTKIRFTRTRLRTLFGNAAYELDQQLASLPASAKGTQG